MERDPAITNPQLYRVVMENDRVRVLEYKDQPGDRTSPHRHPDSVMVTLAAFRRRLVGEAGHQDVELDAGQTRWLAAQEHSGENVGTSGSHAIFIELKEPRPTEDAGVSDASLGPTSA